MNSIQKTYNKNIIVVFQTEKNQWKTTYNDIYFSKPYSLPRHEVNRIIVRKKTTT